MTTYRTWTPALVLGVLLSMFFVDAAAAQGTAPGQRGTGFVFELSPTGARALGMGGTFIAFADDATAAEANPAGLPQLEAPEISANLRITSMDNPAAVDFAGTEASFSDRVTSPTFIGYAHPFADGAFAVYYQQTTKGLVHSEFEDTSTPIVFIGEEFLVNEQYDLDQQLQTFGGSIAYSFAEYVAVGASVRFSSLDWTQMRSLRLTEFDDPPDAVTLNIEHTELDDSREVTFNFGVLVNPGGVVSGGFVYKQGAEYELQRSTVPTCSGLTGPLCNPINFTIDTAVLTLPTVIGGGVKFDGGGFRVGADIVQVSYSDMQDSFEFLFGFPADDPLDDVIQVHAGGEYGFGEEEDARGFVRAGIFTSPDHDGVAAVDTDRIHFTAGAGGVFGDMVLLDGGINLADGITEALFSLGIRFR